MIALIEVCLAALLVYYVIGKPIIAILSALDENGREKRRVQKQKEIVKVIEESPDAWDKYYVFREKGLALNKEKGILGIFFYKGEKIQKHLVKGEDILSLECFVDEQSQIKSERKGQLSSALVGGLAFGTKGFLAGSIWGGHTEVKSSSKVHKIELRIGIEDYDLPQFRMCFWDSPLDSHSKRVQKIEEDLQKWYHYITILMRKSEKQKIAMETESKSADL